MASLRGARFLNIRKVWGQVTTQRCIATSKPLAWNKDNKARELQPTKEGYDRAAKSYNLMPEDYKPVSTNPNDGLGDYPDVTAIPLESRDPNIDWDYKASRRFYGEPANIEHDMLGRSNSKLEERHLISYPQQFMAIFAVIGLSLAVAIMTSAYPLHHKAKPKQYPYNYIDTPIREYINEEDIVRRVHYSFEPATPRK